MASIRAYEDRDADAIVRLWREIGWIDDSDRQHAGLLALLRGGRALVGEVDGAPECFAQTMPGRIRHLADDLALLVVNAVTTSHVARRLGLASATTARLIADGATRGAQVAVLGMFEQGFYDQLGFGSGSPTTRFTFDPSTLRVPVPERPPVRVGVDDAREVLELLDRSQRSHGGVVIDDLDDTTADLAWRDLTLGVRDASGRLTGLLSADTSAAGVADISVLAGVTADDVLALLGVVKGLSDQWYRVTTPQPPGLQLQDLIDRPLRQRRVRRDTHLEPFSDSIAWWQVRLLDLEAAVTRVRWVGPPLRFVLRLDDPLSGRGDVDWAGLAGDWLVTLGPDSCAEPGTDSSLPVLSSGIAAFSRLWLGVRPASVLARSTDLRGSADLLARIDDGLWAPPPQPGRFF